MKTLNTKALAKSYNPWAKGYFSAPDGSIGFRCWPSGYVWVRLTEAIPGFIETGSTLTKENGTFVGFEK